MESKQCCIYLQEYYKVLQKKMKFCKKISFGNKNKYFQNINETEQKQCFCNTYFPWPYIQMYLQRCFYFAFQSSFPLCASHFTCLTLWHCFDMGACTTGLITPPWKRRHRSQLIQAPSLSRGMRVDRLILFTSFTTCMFNFINFINKCICV